MRLPHLFDSRMRAIAVGGALIAVVGAGSAVAAGQIDSQDIRNNTVTSADVKDGTLQTRDLTKNNFAKFTATEQVVAAMTPASGNASYNGAHVVDVGASGTTPLTTLVLDKGTYQLTGTAQFWHLTGPAAGTDYGVVTVNGLQSGFETNVSADVPDGGANPAQLSFSGTIKITADNTSVVIAGSFTGGNAGQAGASVQATQYEYVKQFHHGQS
jgi:hypothetical protein